MAFDELSRGQKLVLSVMALALIGLLVLLGTLVSQSEPVSPLPTLLLPSPGSPVATGGSPRPSFESEARETPAGPVPTQRSPTSGPPGGVAEVLAARRIKALVQDVGQIRELPRQQEVPLNFMSDSELNAYLRQRLYSSEYQENIERQHALLAALDLLPAPGEDFAPTVRTRARQLLAFYDADEAQIFVSPSGRDSDPMDFSLVHQYAHALIDQHFSLITLTSDAPNMDAARARDALLEGDATAVLSIHRFGGIVQADLHALAEHLHQVELTDYEGLPLSRDMRDVYAFPYREGTRFVAALLDAGWWLAVNAAYLDPPVSTEQILHPEKYIETPRDRPRMVFLPDLGEDLGEGWRLLGQYVLGELILRAHLDKYLPDTSEAQSAAAGWDGDLAAIWQNLDGRQVLVMRSVWDNTTEADEFVRGYTDLIDRRLRGASRILRPIVPSGGRWWRGDAGNAYIQRRGGEVLIIWAPETDIMERVLAVFVLD